MPNDIIWPKNSKKVDFLAIAVHPDDIELCFSGTLFKQQALGYSIALCDMTRGELGSRGTAKIRLEEAEEARLLFGAVPRVNLLMKDGFIQQDEASLLKVIQAIRFFQPRIILTNTLSDRHPDHGLAANLIARAAFLAGLIKISTKVNDLEQAAHRPKLVLHGIQDHYHKPDIVVDITQHMEDKIRVIMAYHSQFYAPDMKGPQTPISSAEYMKFLEARAREMGRIIGVEYGEGFNVIRPVGVEDLMLLI